ncbi:MAG: aldehyde dehydrogenase family protein [Bacteroidales bacterium]|nr:aldehyde dehydrogenase family protein [Bacteroidales bacterium]
MIKLFKPWIGGKFVESGNRIIIRNPYDTSPVGETCLVMEDLMDEAIQKAFEIFEVFKKTPSYRRYTILMNIAHLLENRRNDAAMIIACEAAKPLKLALAEVDRAIQVFRIAAEEAKRIGGEYVRLDWTPAGEGKTGIVQWFPRGVVGGISPFNFPLNLAVHKIAPAIAAGCPIVLKPSSKTPLSTLFLAELMAQTELPEGVVSIVPATATIGQMLVTDPRPEVLSFTGSAEVGWKMKSMAGKKKVILELGGNAGVIVTPSSNLAKAIPKIVSGSFSYAGQVCIHTQRIYVHNSIFESFISDFVSASKKLRIGPPQDISTDFTSMIDEDNAIRVEEWVQEALDQGAKLLLGGKRQGGLFPPTILTNTSYEMKVCQLEIFGPVVTVEPYHTFEEALSYVNNSRYGLQAGVFTNAWNEIQMAFDQLQVGGVIINDVPTFRVDHMPYGGMKDSGFGREGVRYAMESYMERKLLVLGL